MGDIMVTNEELAPARQSLIEELDAINKYEERIPKTNNAELKKVLAHNAKEEKEHVAMLMEWLRKNDPDQDKVFEEHD